MAFTEASARLPALGDVADRLGFRDPPVTGETLRGVAVAAVLDEWAALDERAPARAYFQSAAFARPILEALAASASAPVEARAAVVRRDGRLVGLLPVGVSSGPVRVARLLGEPLVQYGDALVDREDGAAIAAALVDVVRGWRDVDALVLKRVPEDAAIRPALVKRGARVLDPADGVHAVLTGFTDTQDYGKSIDVVQTRERRRLRRRLDEGTPAKIELIGGGPRAAALLDTALAWKAEWLSARGLASAAFDDPVWRDALMRLVARPDRAGGVLMTVVEKDGEPIAVELGFRGGDTLFAFLGAHKPGTERASPTKAAMEETVAWCLAEGVRVYDLLVPADTYKDCWVNARVATGTLVLPVTLKGRLYGEVLGGGLKRMVKRWVDAAPEGVRAWIRRRV